MAGEGLTGSCRVRAIRSARSEAEKLFPRVSDRMEIRAQALKLRYWPVKHPTDSAGQILDLDWSWIRSLPGLRVGELRVADTIGGQDNVRIIFFDGGPTDCDPLPTIWVIRVMQKKRDDFSCNDIQIFKARRTLVNERFYKDRCN